MLSDDPVRDFADRVIRDSLLHPDHLRGLLEQAAPQLAPNFDYSKARLLEREFPLDDWRHREADLPFEIPFVSGETATSALVVLLIEHQSDTDPLMPLRSLYFAVTYWDRQWRAWQDAPPPRRSLKLRPVFPLVLYTGTPTWGSNRSLADLLDLPAVFHSFAPKWEPVFWNLAEQSAESLLASNNGWVQTLAVIRSEREGPTAFQGIFADAIDRLKLLSSVEPARWYDLMRILLTWAIWRRPRPERDALLAIAKRNQSNTEREQEIERMSNQLGATLVDIARAEGKVIASRENLRGLLEERFGTLPEELQRRIEKAEDLDQLQRAIRQVVKIKNFSELEI